MKRILLFIALAVAMPFVFCGCNHVHEFDEWQVEKEATCAEEGISARYCSCGEKQTKIIEKLSHVPGEWIVDKAPTCTEEGSKHNECTLCHTTLETAPVDKKEHSYVETVIPPTQEEAGYTEYKCSVCGYTYKDKAMSQQTVDK